MFTSREAPTYTASSPSQGAEAARRSQERVLAVRLAGADFDGPFALRSPSFESLIREWPALREQRDRTRERLVGDLYRLVPTVTDRVRRRQLLDAKRDVFNDRPTTAPDPTLPMEARCGLERFNRLCRSEHALLEMYRPAILRELRESLDRAAHDPRLRLACGYASEALTADLDASGLPAGGDLTPLERGLHAYTSRFVSKCNPFHLFGEMAFCHPSGLAAPNQHEVVLDIGVLLDLERTLLPLAHDRGELWTCLLPFEERGTALQFWVPTPKGRRLIAVARDASLTAIIEFFEHRRAVTGRPTGRLSQLREYVATKLPGDVSAIDERVRQLADRGIIGEYLISNPNAFGAELRGLDPEWDQWVAVLERHHLAMKRSADLGTVHEELRRYNVHAGRPTEPAKTFFVNSYRSIDTQSIEDAVAPVLEELADLKPLFNAFHNFQDYDYVIRAYIRDLLGRTGRRRMPLLELLREFLPKRDQIVERYHPARPGGDPMRQQDGAWRRRLASLTGAVTRGHLQELIAGAPVRQARSLCFVGPVDFADPMFFVTHVYSGERRYLGRYLLNGRTASERRHSDESDALDVELAVPPPPNLNYVVPTYTTGCGFDPRWSHRYARWIDPQDIYVACDAGEIEYRLAPSNVQLRFHYRGFQLAPQLPTEYQILLVGHADAFENPFLRSSVVHTTDDVIYDEGVVYGRVTVRRESWNVSTEVLRPLLVEDDSIRFALRLRESLHRLLTDDSECWYFATHGAGPRPKPRFLDLRNPMSAYAFRRLLEASKSGSRVSFTQMRPMPQELLGRGRGRRVHEVMIEV